MNSKQFVLLLVVLLIVASGVGWFLASRSLAPATTETGGGTTVKTNGQAGAVQQTTGPTPIVTPADAQTQKIEADLKKSGTALEATWTIKGSGTVSQSNENGYSIFKITAQLPAPPNGQFYEGWLADTVNSQFLPLGKLSGQNGTYGLTGSTDSDTSTYDQVWVTLETTDDQQPEQQVLQGFVKK